MQVLGCGCHLLLCLLAGPANQRSQLMKLGSGLSACSAGLRLCSSTAQAQPLRCAVRALIASNEDGLLFKKV